MIIPFLAAAFLLQAPQRTIAIDERLAADANLKVGDRVSANWKKGGQYYNGKITSRDGDKIHISYDDGDQEDTTISVVRVQR